MSKNGVTVRCMVCGLEVTGRLQRDGLHVKPDNRVRPEPGSRVRNGLCTKHAEGGGTRVGG